MLETQRSAATRTVEAIPGYPTGRAVVPYIPLDSLNFPVALHQEFRVDVTESDAGKLATIAACVEYLARAQQPRTLA